jgi:asparaginyl-tRNA synthetase
MDIKQIVKEYKKLKTVEFNAFVKFNRQYKALGFLIATDGTVFDTVQVVYKKDTNKNFEELQAITNGSSIKVKGEIALTPKAKQPFEIVAKTIEVLSLSEQDYPLQNKEHSNEYLRDIAHLRPRTNYFSAVMKMRSLIANYVHEFFNGEGYL